jgi:outer membrane protein assembly factor BamA
LRELSLKKGELFDSQAAVNSIKNIYSTGLFDRVTLNVAREDSTNLVKIKVKEKNYLLMRLGANVSTERKAKAFVELADDNLFGREIKLSLMGLIGDLDRRAEFKIFSVRLFNTLITYRLSLYYKDRWDRYYNNFVRLGNYFTIQRGISFVLGQQIARLGSIGAKIRWDNLDVFSSDESFPYNYESRIRSITIRSVVDKRDKLPFPERGIYNRWFWETGNQKLLGGSVSFTKFFIALEGYYPILNSFTYRIKVAGGSGDLTMPFSEFFALGGMLDFPGLHERERLGRQIALLNNEIRYNFRGPIPINMYFGINYNIGATWESPEDPIQRSDFLSSWGLYLAANSLLGPIRFTYGRLVGTRDILYFSLGYDF